MAVYTSADRSLGFGWVLPFQLLLVFSQHQLNLVSEVVVHFEHVCHFLDRFLKPFNFLLALRVDVKVKIAISTLSKLSLGVEL